VTSLRDLAQYRFEGRSEAAVREEWIRPLLVHLGYGITTLNEVRYEQQLALATPFRRIGRQRVDVDYVPTVLGHGLWIIEAKAHQAEAWDDAISQAWLYATHPEIDVPFMVIADGARTAAYDTYKPDWDAPVVDISTRRLEAEFGDLADILGAANVTRAVRTRRMRHLGLAMQAELNPGRLEEYVTDVRQLAAGARQSVQENMRTVLSDQFRLEQERQRDEIATDGLSAAAGIANQPFGTTLLVCRQALDRLLSVPPEQRAEEFNRLRDAVRYPNPDGSSGGPRMFWSLRHLELYVALSALREPGCEEFGAFARQAVRDYILDFPDDELARAAHRLERILPIFTTRWLRSNARLDLGKMTRDLQQHWSDETRLRARVSSDRLLLQLVISHAQTSWQTIAWDTNSLNQLSAILEGALPTMTAAEGVDGAAVERDLAYQYEEDMLRMATLYETGALIDPELLDGELVDELRRLVAEHGDRIRIVVPASELIAAYDQRLRPEDE
jgi:hypothetical protein